MNKKKYLIILAVLILVYVGFWQWTRPYVLDPARLAQQALAAPNAAERRTAVLEFAGVDGPEAIAAMERVVQESNDPDVQSRMIPLLVARSPTGQTTNLLLDTLDHRDRAIRQAAFDGLQRVVNLAAEDKSAFNPDAADEAHAALARNLKVKYRPIPISPGTVVASAKAPRPTPATPEAPPTPAAGLPATASSLAPPAPAASSPAAAISSAPPASYPPAGPITVAEHPTVTLLVIMFQALAVTVLLAEIAGIVGLAIGERRALVRARDKSLSAEEQRFEALLARTSAGLWGKVALLIGGALCIVALFAAAEALRMMSEVNQKMDHLLRMR